MSSKDLSAQELLKEGKKIASKYYSLPSFNTIYNNPIKEQKEKLDKIISTIDNLSEDKELEQISKDSENTTKETKGLLEVFTKKDSNYINEKYERLKKIKPFLKEKIDNLGKYYTSINSLFSTLTIAKNKLSFERESLIEKNYLLYNELKKRNDMLENKETLEEYVNKELNKKNKNVSEEDKIFIKNELKNVVLDDTIKLSEEFLKNTSDIYKTDDLLENIKYNLSFVNEQRIVLNSLIEELETNYNKIDLILDVYEVIINNRTKIMDYLKNIQEHYFIANELIENINSINKEFNKQILETVYDYKKGVNELEIDNDIISGLIEYIQKNKEEN